MNRYFALLALCLILIAPTLSRANPYGDMVRVEALPGWRMADGSHMAAMRVVLADGWKTYWRAPGDAGIPPLFDWSGSRNMDSVTPQWPTPVVFSQNGMRSIGYKRELLLPLHVKPLRPGQPVELKARVQIGICNDICVPVDLSFVLPLAADTRPDAAIASALADRPVDAGQAGLRDVSCSVAPSDNGLRLTAQLRMPGASRATAVVVETADPQVWVAEAVLARDGDRLTATTELMHVDGGAFALDRSGLRLTVLGLAQAIDIRGCPAP